MARIPERELEQLKQEVSVQRLAEGMGITLKRHGADLLGLCPFHDDKEPSLVVTPKENLWHCLGACQCGGSVIDWAMKAEGVSFRHAVELLQADYAPSSLAADPVRRSTVQKLPTMRIGTRIGDRPRLNTGNKRVFDLVMQNGTSQSPFCTRSSTTYCAPAVPVTGSTLQLRKLVAAPGLPT